MNSTQLRGDPPFQLSTNIGLPRLAAWSGGSLRSWRRWVVLPLRGLGFLRKYFISLHRTLGTAKG
jgi:hypothetical protein